MEPDSFVPLPTLPQLKQDLLQKEQEIASLTHRLTLSEALVEKQETQLKEMKTGAEDGETYKTASEGLNRKITMLEEELERAEKDLKEAHEKWVFEEEAAFFLPFRLVSSRLRFPSTLGLLAG